MTDKELHKLKRAELLEMLVEQGKEVEQLRAQLEEANKKLEDKQICLNKAGNIAQASLQLNGVFDAAQEAAQQYLENIQRLNDRQEQVCKLMEQSTREKCDTMIQEAQRGVEERWKELSTRLENFYNEHKGLRELLELTGGTQFKRE
ncbi:MAG: hypothetical protein ACI4D9_06895 [Lachnospiraceae bacterium]